MRSLSTNTTPLKWFRRLLLFIVAFSPFYGITQDCPPNIDFESGSFYGWTCYTGFVSGESGFNYISLTPTSGPVEDRHTMYSNFPGGEMDPFGNFPVNCPNGSGYSIRLGNNLGGGQAEGISYEFTIPTNRDEYNLIYNYAVVFQDPNHLPFQQPRMEIEITNVTDNIVISCSSFTFFPNGSPLPGFHLSPVTQDDTPIWYKNWSAVSINLDHNAGKRIRLFFKTADCTFRRHFGYAYIDVNSECSGSFIGASFCPQDTSITVVAPFGYQHYAWYNSDFTVQYMGGTILILNPPPPPGTVLAVVLTPYPGYGCADTLYVELKDNLNVTVDAGRDTTACNHNPVPIGKPPKPGFIYSWSPPAGLSDPHISNPQANPDVATTYVVTASSVGGGCVSHDTITVGVGILDNSIELIGDASFCIGQGSAMLRVLPTDSIQWYRDNEPIPGATQTLYFPMQSGIYHARLFSNNGCVLNTASKVLNISSIPVAGFTADKQEQCLIGNKFTFTNTSTNAVGDMFYQWTLGDGTEAYTRDVVHTYAKAGTYKVKLIVSSNVICQDSVLFSITVHQNVYPEFTARPVCINLPAGIINNTQDNVGSPVHYLWNFGNGQLSDQPSPPPPVYMAEGVYEVSLSVSTDQCPDPVLTHKEYLVVDKPMQGITYPEKTAVMNLPLDLQARQIGQTALWSPPVKLDDATSFNPVFRGNTEQLYMINITTPSGCMTVDTQFVKIAKSIEIFVPTAFTPDNDGVNDYLRPTTIGIKRINYFRVYNRWGQLMFEMRSDRPGWDGMLKGVRQEMQTYVWVMEALGVDGNVYVRKGTSILIR